jgi:hypothetical protein
MPFDPDSYLASAVSAPQAGPAPSPQPDVASQPPQNVQFDPDSYLHGALQQQPAVSNGGMPGDAELKAEPKPGFWDTVRTEARNAISPLIGDSPQQKLDREQAISSLNRISPTLAQEVQDSVTPKQKDFQQGGLAKTLGGPIDTALQAGGGTAGQSVGAMTGPFAPVAIPLLGALGGAGGDYLAQRRRIAEGDQDSMHTGELVASGIAGAIPGGNLAKSGVGAVVSQGVKQGLGGLAAETARSEIDDGQLPSIKNAAWASILPALAGSVAEHVSQTSPEISAARGSAEAKIASKAETLKAGQDLGMVVEPSQVNPSIINKSIESLAGGPSIKQAATHVNQEVADEVARQVLDPSNPNVDLTSDLAKAVRQRAYDNGYLPVAKVGTIPTDPTYASDLNNIVSKYTGAARSFPGAVNNDIQDLVNGVNVQKFDSGDAIQMIQNLRNNASDAFAQGKSGLGKASRDAASAIEGQIERYLNTSTSGMSGQGTQMLNDFRDARTLMAQSHDIEDSIREGGSHVVPSVLARKAQNQTPFTGDLKTVADFSNNFPTMTREASKTPVPGTTVTGTAARLMYGGLFSGAAGATTHSPEAAALAGAAGLLVPSIRGLVRNMVLSKPYQRIMAKYPVTVEANPDLGGLVIRQAGQAAALQPNASQSAQSSPEP